MIAGVFSVRYIFLYFRIYSRPFLLSDDLIQKSCSGQKDDEHENRYYKLDQNGP